MAAASAIVAAAGSGERLGAGSPKAFVDLYGAPLLAWSVRALAAARSVEEIVVAAPPGHEEAALEVARAAAEGVDAKVVAGGASRSDSVANALGRSTREVVAVHDAARPLVTAQTIDDVVAALGADDGLTGAIAAMPIADTVKLQGRGDDRAVIERTVPRDGLWAAQTPQAFRAEALRTALADPGLREHATDEAMLVEVTGGRVALVASGAENLKVTTPHDLSLAAMLLRGRDEGG